MDLVSMNLTLPSRLAPAVAGLERGWRRRVDAAQGVPPDATNAKLKEGDVLLGQGVDVAAVVEMVGSTG
jgi:hypothetical protein